MKKSIKNIIAAVLTIPAFLIGSMAVSAPVGAIECPTGKAPSEMTIAEAAACQNVAGGPTCLFGKDAADNDCVLTIIINFALYFIGAISVLMLIIGGVRYTLSGGNEKAVSAAKNTILYAVIGVVVALLAYAIVNFVLVTLASPTV